MSAANIPRPQIRPVRTILGRRVFIDVPFLIHGRNPAWVPPLRLSVYDRLSPRHPAATHQEIALWVAYRHGRPVGRIGACIDTYFNQRQGERWAWVGFFDAFDDSAVATALFEEARRWAAARGAERCVGPANFTTNDELGLQVEGFEEPPAVLTLENPPYYERLWTEAGWKGAMDLWGWHLDKASTSLSERQRRALERIQQRAKVRVRSLDMSDFDAEVGRFFEVYNSAWSENWGFAPMPEPEVRHLAKQLKQILNPNWAFGLEKPDGEVVGVCLAVPDVNRLMAKVRSGRLLPFGWVPLLTGKKRLTHARVWALGIKPGYQALGLGPLMYREIVDRLSADPYIQTAEASWTLATNHRINDQILALGARRSKVWRLYQRSC